ncbi:hypothetical protein N7468_000228 [Penicillium chermesinum]|uniref:Stress response protein rds1p n=1 Tax=Penicillium chermesinum TaxID=63820 RepID=A0A9W9PJW3_9EURO|nr:uncharacterized protein N7468_000228 [Penicillium chermesinum]KAJ5248777.1 hypothetical protein N7468_000228 [Penicillium chermesinum]
MHLSIAVVASLAVITPTFALPAFSGSQLKSAADAVPGESSLFVNYQGKKTPLASNYTKVSPATGSGPAGADDLLFQNLLSAEWVIYSFYQRAVEYFSASDFTKLGFPNNTYERIVEIRDNEAGHVRIFQDQISKNSITPGPCTYTYGFNQLAKPNSTKEFLALQVLLEVSSMAFLTGLANQADLNISKSALMAIGQVESRHNTWSLIDVYNVSPFLRPLGYRLPLRKPDPGSDQHNLPRFTFNPKTTTARPGSTLEFVFQAKPTFAADKDYWAVFYHDLNQVSVPYDPKKNVATIPKEFDSKVGVIMVNIADEKDAPTEDSVVAGPLIILEQPGSLTLLLD